MSGRRGSRFGVSDTKPCLLTPARSCLRPSRGNVVLVIAHRGASLVYPANPGPAVPTAWLTLPGLAAERAVAACVEGGHRALHPHHLSVTAALVGAAHAAGVAVNTWTVDDPDRMAELIALGVDGICTNAPDVLR